MKVLVKVGGTLLDEEASRKRIARELAALARGRELVVVHGGGKQVTRFLEQQGIESRFVGGWRVSDARVVEAVTKVIAGGVNKQLVAAMVAAGSAAVGISGVDGLLTIARPVSEELGLVGQPVETRPWLLETLVAAGYVPIVACIAGDEAGHIYNVNADQMAVSCALGWGASKLIFLTDVAGVKMADGQVAGELPVRAIGELIRSGVAHGGMQAKLEAARLALDQGVDEVTIAPGHEPLACAAILAGAGPGTKLKSGREAAGAGLRA